MNIGDSVGGLYLRERDGKDEWVLIEDKITKITITKREGRRYFTKSKFRPLYADDVDSEEYDFFKKIWLMCDKVCSTKDNAKTDGE